MEDIIPCKSCNAACCRKRPGFNFAVVIKPEEAAKFPEAKTISLYGEETKVLPYKNGKCIHLSDDNQCRIYDSRPEACKSFDCQNSYLLFGKHHGGFLQDNPHVVPLIQLHCPNFVLAREAEKEQRTRAARLD